MVSVLSIWRNRLLVSYEKNTLWECWKFPLYIHRIYVAQQPLSAGVVFPETQAPEPSIVWSISRSIAQRSPGRARHINPDSGPHRKFRNCEDRHIPGRFATEKRKGQREGVKESHLTWKTFQAWKIKHEEKKTALSAPEQKGEFFFVTSGFFSWVIKSFAVGIFIKFYCSEVQTSIGKTFQGCKYFRCLRAMDRRKKFSWKLLGRIIERAYIKKQKKKKGKKKKAMRKQRSQRMETGEKRNK